jgi:hypothetical protein
VFVAYVILLIAFEIWRWPTIYGNPSTIGTDSSNYYAAGLRLNAGHDLYALVPGDRPVPLSPPYYSIPLLAPPPIAVVWRGLALLGEGSMTLWWAGSILAVLATTIWLARRAPLPVLAALCVISPGLVFSAVSGNANSFLLPAVIGAWLLRDRLPMVAGGLIAVAAAVKLLPALLLVWLVLRGGRAGRRGVAGFALAGVAIGLVSVAGAGLDAHLEYLRAIRDPANGAATAFSLPGLAGSLGLPAAIAALAIPAAILIAVVSAIRWRSDERISFAALVAAAALATPAMSMSTFALLPAALVPWLKTAAAPAREANAQVTPGPQALASDAPSNS